MAKATMTYLNKENLETADADRTAAVSGKLKALLGKESDKLGHMPEHAGGGQPISKGSTWEKESNKKRAPQPYDPETGKFTNNSMNFRNLDYKPQRSSGKSMNEIFGGVQDIFGKGSVIATEDAERMILSADFTRDDLVRAMAEYDEESQSFKDEDYVPTVKKHGRPSKAEKEAIDNGGGVVGPIDTEKLSQNTRDAIDKAAEEFADKKANWIYGKNSEDNAPAKPTKPIEPTEPTTPPNDDEKEFDAEELKKDPQKFANSNRFKRTYKDCVPEKYRDKVSVPFVLTCVSKGVFKNPKDIKDFIKEKFGDD